VAVRRRGRALVSLCLCVSCVLQVVAQWQHKLLLRCFMSWREYVLVRQQYGIIARVVTNKRVNKLLLVAWTAWRVSTTCVSYGTHFTA
jgi:hypothetical protein